MNVERYRWRNVGIESVDRYDQPSPQAQQMSMKALGVESTRTAVIDS
jgi:hypothetical protein